MPTSPQQLKSLEELLEKAAGKDHLSRELGPLSITSLGISGIIGTGIFIMTGMAAHAIAGPAVIVSFLIAALACIASALCYAEFAALAPVAGSAYTYAYITLGRVAAWLVGWNLILQYLLAASSVAQGWSHYFQNFLSGVGVRLPKFLTSCPFASDGTGALHFTSPSFDLSAMLITLVITLIIIRGMHLSLRLNSIMLILKLGIIFFVIVVGAFYIHPSNWHPFAPYGYTGLSLLGYQILGKAGSHGQSVGVLAGAALVFYAYLGFDSITNYTEECRNPQRDLPRGIIAAVSIATFLYIAVCAVLTGMVHYDKIDMNAPVSEAFRQVGLPWAQILVSLGAFVGITSVLLIILLSLPRILLAMGRDRMISPKIFTAMHPHFNTTWRSNLFVGTLTMLFSGLVPLDVLSNLVVMSTLSGFVFVAVAVLILRKTQPELNRPFRAPLGALFPLICIVFCLVLVLSLPPVTFLWLVVYLGIGGLIYAFRLRISLQKDL